jgi:hypothetical protein
MKIVQNTSNPADIRKVKNEEAMALVSSGKYNFKPKSLWKSEIRDKQ